MLRSPRRLFIILLVLAALLVVIDLPNPPTINMNLFGFRIRKELKTRLGLDLSGGTSVLLEADMKDVPEQDRPSALESAREVIERRVNLFGVSEPVVQSARSQNHHRIIVELPGVTDVDTAIALIGQTAKLEFREFLDLSGASPSGFLIPTLNFHIL